MNFSPFDQFDGVSRFYCPQSGIDRLGRVIEKSRHLKACGRRSGKFAVGTHTDSCHHVYITTKWWGFYSTISEISMLSVPFRLWIYLAICKPREIEKAVSLCRVFGVEMQKSCISEKGPGKSRASKENPIAYQSFDAIHLQLQRSLYGTIASALDELRWVFMWIRPNSHYVVGWL